MLLAVPFVAAAPAAAAPAQAVTTPAAQAVAAPAEVPAQAQTSQVSEDELILFSVQLEAVTLSEAVNAYGDPADPHVPLGELARLLELDLRLSPAAGRITGSTGEARTPIIVDIPSRTARAAGREVPLETLDARTSLTDIYVRASAIQLLLPFTLQVDPEALTLTVLPTQKLPIQAQMERIARLRSLGPQVEQPEEILRIESPYELFSPPAFDVILESGTDTRSTRFARRYDLRAAGDLLFAGYQAFLGSDDRGRPQEARILFERRSREGDLLGPLGATRVSGGDVFTPSLTFGPRSVAGRGFSFTTAPLEQASVFETIDLRGELPIGYDVELYINDVLRSGQRAPVQGRYEFLDVPLVRGINVIRIVSYGPQGDRSEQVRILNVGSGQLETGQTSIDFGIVEQERPVFSVRATDPALVGEQVGELRAVASIAYGFSEALTVVGGAALYPTVAGGRRQMLSAGIRTSLFGFAAHADTALDHKGGVAAGFGLAGQPGGISAVLTHAEYRGGFIDENQIFGDPTRRLSRHTELTLDFTLPPIGGESIPVSLRALRDGFRGGGSNWIGSARASTTLLDTLISAGVDYQRQTAPNLPKQEQLAGMLAVSRFVNFEWQLRGVLDYDLLPSADFRSISFTADRAVSDRIALRFGIGHLLQGERTTTLQAGATFRLPFGDLALTGDFSTPGRDWSVGLRFAFGLGYDPGAGRYRVTPPGPASGGSAVFRSFIDPNGNGRFDPGEEPVPGVAVEGAERAHASNERGQAFITGLGNAPTGRLQIGTERIENFYVTAPPSVVEFSPRPGKVVDIHYPLTPAGEIYARLLFRQADGNLVGLSAVRVRLVREGQEPRTGTTEFDGSVVFSNVPLGEWRLELDPGQAQQLGMRLDRPVVVTVDGDGEAPPELSAEIVFDAPPAPEAEDEEQEVSDAR